jgi:hypothetical protein
MTMMHSAMVDTEGNEVLVLGKRYGNERLPRRAWFPRLKIWSTVIPKHAPISVQYTWSASSGEAGEKSGLQSSKPMLRLSAVS